MVGAITGVLAAAVGKTLRSNPVISIFRTACGLILIALGVGILMRS
jgi:threonine/homoserine/homoserine lactone efflux protein